MSQNHKTYLVTGGAGFIGSHLIEKLIKDKHNIVLIDDLSSGQLDNIKEIDHAEIITKKVQKTDLNDLGKIDGIFHLAAQSSVPVSIDDFYSSSSNNLLSSIRVFEWAKQLGVPVVYASSSAVYGNLAFGDDQVADYDILSPYAQDKLTMEHYARMCWDIFGTPSMGLRFFNVYGPRQDPSNPYSGVISIFVDRLLKTLPVTVNGGYQTRDFIFVKDIVDVMYQSMGILFIKNQCDFMNVGTNVSVTIDELLNIIAEILHVKPEIILKELPKGDPVQSSGTYKKIKTILNIETDRFINLESGLKKTVDFIKNDSNI